MRNEGSVGGWPGPFHGTAIRSVRPRSASVSFIVLKMVCSPVHGRPMQCATPRTVSSACTNGYPPGFW
jgi:hypothetical protein